MIIDEQVCDLLHKLAMSHLSLLYEGGGLLLWSEGSVSCLGATFNTGRGPIKQNTWWRLHKNSGASLTLHVLLWGRWRRCVQSPTLRVGTFHYLIITDRNGEILFNFIFLRQRRSSVISESTLIDEYRCSIDRPGLQTEAQIRSVILRSWLHLPPCWNPTPPSVSVCDSCDILPIQHANWYQQLFFFFVHFIDTSHHLQSRHDTQPRSSAGLFLVGNQKLGVEWSLFSSGNFNFVLFSLDQLRPRVWSPVWPF